VFIYVKEEKKTLDLDQTADPDPGPQEMLIQILGLQKSGSNADPNPKPWQRRKRMLFAIGTVGPDLLSTLNFSQSPSKFPVHILSMAG